MISTIMTTDVVTLNVNDSLTTAEELLKNNNIRHIPVVSGSEIVGMLSYSDILKIGIPDVDDEEDKVVSLVYDMYTIDQVMTKDVKTLRSTDFIKDAALIFSESEFRALPIVDDSNNLVGILSTTDLIKFLLTQFNA